MIPKSLHTITAFTRVAAHIAANEGRPITKQNAYTLASKASRVLGYGTDAKDLYGLIDKAAAALLKNAK